MVRKNSHAKDNKPASLNENPERESSNSITRISFTVYGDSVPKARARTVFRNGKVRSYTPVKTAKWEEYIRMTALEHRPKKLLDGPLALEAIFYRLKPKSKKNLYPDTKPDLDNLCKSVTDALEGIIFTNDSRFVDKILKKRYGDPPRVEITIWEKV